MSLDAWHYKRNEFAYDLYTALRDGPNPARLLFAPRRTGKTAFLINDLGFLADTHGCKVVYVSFWQNIEAPIDSFIAGCKDALSKRSFAQRAGDLVKDYVGLELGAEAGPVKFNFKLGKKETVPEIPPGKFAELDHLLKRLAGYSQPTFLFLDEFQALAEHPQGDEIMAAIRKFIEPRSTKLKTVFTGSSLIELDKVFQKRGSPMFNYATEIELPELGRPFVEHIAKKLADPKQLSDDIDEAEEIFSARLDRNPQLTRYWASHVEGPPARAPEAAITAMFDTVSRRHGMSEQWEARPASHRAVAAYLAQTPCNIDGSDDGPSDFEAVTGHAPLPRSTRQSAVRALKRLGWVDARKAEKRIADPLVRFWIREHIRAGS